MKSRYLTTLLATTFLAAATQAEVLQVQVSKTLRDCNYETVTENSYNKNIVIRKSRSLTEITEEVISDSLTIKSFTGTSTTVGEEGKWVSTGKVTSERYGSEREYTIVTMSESEGYLLNDDGTKGFTYENAQNRIVTDFTVNENGTTTVLTKNLTDQVNFSYIETTIEIDDKSSYVVSFLLEPYTRNIYSTKEDEDGNIIEKAPTGDFSKYISSKSVCLVTKLD